MREYRGDLERAHHPASGDVGRALGSDVVTVIDDGPGARLEKLRQQVEDGRLAGAVWTDQRVNGAAPDFEVHALHCREAAEFLRQATGFEDQIIQAQSRHSRPGAGIVFVAWLP